MKFGVAKGAHLAFDVGEVSAAEFDEEAAAIEVGLGGGFHRVRGGLEADIVHADARASALRKPGIDISRSARRLEYQLARVAGFAKDAWETRREIKENGIGKLGERTPALDVTPLLTRGLPQ